MRMLYKYPQAAFPVHAAGRGEPAARQGCSPEFELIDTGVFDDNRYFDVEIEYAKADADDILMQVTVHNRADEAASLHVLPQLWARNIWSWEPDSAKPRLIARERSMSISVDHPQLPPLQLFCDGAAGVSVLRERHQCRGGCGGWTAPGAISRTGSTITSSTATARR